jgi:hypothetical protein
MCNYSALVLPDMNEFVRTHLRSLSKLMQVVCSVKAVNQSVSQFSVLLTRNVNTMVDIFI